jgi:fucose permease
MGVSPTSPSPVPEAVSPAPYPAGRTLAGFLLSGFLMALPGAILPVWGFYRDPPSFVTAGNYFLSLAGGMALSLGLARRVLSWRGAGFLLVFACCLSCAGLASLALVSPLASAWWRVPGLFTLGLGAGWLNLGLFHGISRCDSQDAARTVNRGGIWYGLGCVAVTLLAALTFPAFAPPLIVLLMTVVPGIFAAVYRRAIAIEPARPPTHAPLRDARTDFHGADFRGADFRNMGAVLFALLLFFQFGSEWSIAGWLPLFLIRRVGFSLGAALRTLALYWLSLLLGRLLAVPALSLVRRGLLLGASVVGALFGCLLLFVTNNMFGALTGVLLVGGGYASIYPLVAEAMRHRFPYYHPGFFSRVFGLATMGGLLAPATLGYAASTFGIGVVVGIPLLGTCMVLVLLISIWVESRLAL